MLDQLTLSHVADHYKCYPGDIVTFSTRVLVVRSIFEYELEIDLAEAFEINDFSQKTAQSQLTNSQVIPQRTMIGGEQKHLFDIDPELSNEQASDLVSELNNGRVPNNLYEQFKKRENTLSQNVYVEVTKAESKWIIVDIDRRYFVQLENQKWRIYIPTQRVRWYVSGQALGQTIDFEVTGKITHKIYTQLENAELEYANNDTISFQDKSSRTLDYIELLSEARLTWKAQPTESGQTISESVTVRVYGRASYLQYLPAIYEQDSFLNQLLIFFESYWRPLQQQLDHIEDYFDPMLTPAPLLPWLAAWFEWEFEEDWPLNERQREQWRRKMLHFALHLHRTRGTEEGLKLYLELYTKGKVKLEPHTSHPLRLGKSAQLGRGIALYQQAQRPHTFTLKVTMPRTFGLDNQGKPLDDTQLTIRKQQLAERIKKFVIAEKPAHTVLTNLQIEIES